MIRVVRESSKSSFWSDDVCTVVGFLGQSLVSYPIRYANKSNCKTLNGTPLSLLRTITKELSQPLHLRHPQRLIHTLNKVPRSPAPSHDTTLLKHAVDGTRLLGHSAKEDSLPIINVAVYNLRQHLRARPIDRRDAVDVKDDILIMLRSAHARQCRVCGVCAVELESAETVLEVACIRKSEGFRDLDDEAALDEFEGLRVFLCVFELVLGAGDFAEDLDAGFGGVADDGEDGEADAEGDAEGQGVEDCGGEDEEHEGEFGPAADVEEEFDVVGGFFDEGVGDDGYHG